MKKIIARVLFFGLVILGYGKSVFAVLQKPLEDVLPLGGAPMRDPNFTAPENFRQTSTPEIIKQVSSPETVKLATTPDNINVIFNLLNFTVSILFLPVIVITLLFYSGYFYLRNKKETIQIERAKKYLVWSKWFLVVFIILFIVKILLWLPNWLFPCFDCGYTGSIF